MQHCNEKAGVAVKKSLTLSSFTVIISFTIRVKVVLKMKLADDVADFPGLNDDEETELIKRDAYEQVQAQLNLI